MTIQLPPRMAERVQEIAEGRGMDVNAFALEVFQEYLEDLEDIKEAHEQTARLARGETHLISMEEVHAEIMAMDDMQDTEG